MKQDIEEHEATHIFHRTASFVRVQPSFTERVHEEVIGDATEESSNISTYCKFLGGADEHDNSTNGNASLVLVRWDGKTEACFCSVQSNSKEHTNGQLNIFVQCVHVL